MVRSCFHSLLQIVITPPAIIMMMMFIGKKKYTNECEERGRKFSLLIMIYQIYLLPVFEHFSTIT